MLRASSYNIYVDLPDSSSEMLLVHGYTGAYDRVSRRVAAYLRSLESRRPPKPLYGEWRSEPTLDEEVAAPPAAVVERLRERGYLTRLSPEDEATFFARLAEKLHERAARQMPSYIFMPTYDCNLRCSYCFQDHMRTDCSFRHLLSTMKPKVVDRIFAAMPGIEARHGLTSAVRRRRNVGLFGGEPLLAANREVVEHILRRALELGEADFWAVTNATELEAYRDLLGPEGIANLQITLDGPPREHDRRRIYADGSGTFERIARNLELALERGSRVSIRLNLDRDNIGELPELAEEIIARGWHEQPGFSVYTAPINPSNEKTDRKRTFNTWQLDQALVALREEHPSLRVIGRPDEGLRARARKIFDREEAVMPQLRPSFCNAHDRMYIFDPFGDIYACWERTGDRKIRIGHVKPEGEATFAHEEVHKWRTRTVASNPVCGRCRYALHCGGGCAILALGQRGEMHANYCDGFASRFRSSVAEAYLAHLAGEARLAASERVCDL